jgi:integrase
MAKLKPSLGGVRKLSSGRWQARYQGPDGRRHNAPQTFPTERTAVTWLNRMDLEIAHGAWRAVSGGEPGTPTFEAYSATYLERRPRLSVNTLNGYNRARRDLVEAFGDRPVDRITAGEVSAWWSTAQFGQRQKQLRYAFLSQVMHEAERDELIERTPCRVRGALNPRRQRDIEVASLEQLRVMVEAMPQEWRAAVLLAAWCSLRSGELLELRRKDVDLVQGTIRVRRAVAFDERRAPSVKEVKSEAGLRTVVVPPHVVPALGEHLARWAWPGGDGLLFPGPGGRHSSREALRKRWVEARAAAGRPDLTFHGLRHTGNTWAAQAGATDAELMARAGHANKAAVAIYQHSTVERDRLIAQRLSELAQGRMGPGPGSQAG